MWYNNNRYSFLFLSILCLLRHTKKAPVLGALFVYIATVSLFKRVFDKINLTVIKVLQLCIYKSSSSLILLISAFLASSSVFSPFNSLSSIAFTSFALLIFCACLWYYYCIRVWDDPGSVSGHCPEPEWFIQGLLSVLYGQILAQTEEKEKISGIYHDVYYRYRI